MIVSARDAAICLIKGVNASERAFVDADSHPFQQTYCQYLKTLQDTSCKYRNLYEDPTGRQLRSL